MAVNFTPPPTYAPVILYNEAAQDIRELIASVRFNPIWLKWFVDVAQFITNSGGGGGGGVDHQSTTNLQGGSATERYHLTSAQHTLATNYTHNSLNGLQGGAATEYFHVTAAQHAALTAGFSGTGNLLRETAPTFTGAAGSFAGRLQEGQGAGVTSANNLTLGADGNYFQINGSTQINRITSTGWQGGSRVTLKFNGNPTIKDNFGSSGADATIILVGSADFTVTAPATLVLVYDATDACWYEISRGLN